MKTHPHPACAPRRFQPAFTLLELLFVVVIIAVVAALAMPGYNKIIDTTHATQTRTIMRSLESGVSHYRADYNRFPVLLPGRSDGDSGAEPLLTDGNNDFINNLMALNDPNGDPNLNLRRHKYVNLPYARDGRFGIIDPSGGTLSGAPISLLDQWGQPYTVPLDTNYDNRIENPDAQNQSRKIADAAPRYLSADVLIFSKGRDMIAQTADDITGWR